jgi:hypothetical protein
MTASSSIHHQIAVVGGGSAGISVAARPDSNPRRLRRRCPNGSLWLDLRESMEDELAPTSHDAQVDSGRVGTVRGSASAGAGYGAAGADLADDVGAGLAVAAGAGGRRSSTMSARGP